MTIRRASGFTLVELLVVILIITVLMGLLLPAVMSAMANARDIECKNNLGQLGKAATNYLSKRTRFPGWANRFQTNNGVINASWQISMLSEIGKADIYNSWAGGQTVTPRVDLFICTADPPASNSSPDNSYVINTGQLNSTNTADGVAFNFFSNPNLYTDASMADGPSNTLLFTENIQAGPYQAANQAQTGFVWYPTLNPSVAQKINGNRDNGSGPRPSSYHSGGVNAAFCDGRVIFLRDSIDYPVYIQLMTSNSAEANTPGGFNYVLNDGDY